MARNAAKRLPSAASSTRSSCETAAPAITGIGGSESSSWHIGVSFSCVLPPARTHPRARPPGPHCGVFRTRSGNLRLLTFGGRKFPHPSVQSARLPPHAESLARSQGTGEPSCWGEFRGDPARRAALSARARQLTRQASERGRCAAASRLHAGQCTAGIRGLRLRAPLLTPLPAERARAGGATAPGKHLGTGAPARLAPPARRDDRHHRRRPGQPGRPALRSPPPLAPIVLAKGQSPEPRLRRPGLRRGRRRRELTPYVPQTQAADVSGGTVAGTPSPACRTSSCPARPPRS